MSSALSIHKSSGWYQYASTVEFPDQRRSLNAFLWKMENSNVAFDKSAMENILFKSFPKKNVTCLLALEDLGRGSNGKCWLVTTRTFSAVCVLKFDNLNRESVLISEAENWRKLYDFTISGLVTVVEWSGSFALMMPHFATIQEGERDSYRDKIIVLLERIHDLGYYHDDIHWRNMGCYKVSARKEGGEEEELFPILFDLIHVKEFDPTGDSNSKSWIAEGLLNLFPSSPNSALSHAGVDSEISIRKNLFGHDDRAITIYEGEDARLLSEDTKKISSARRDVDALIGDLTALTLVDTPVGVVTRLAAARAAAAEQEEEM